MYFFLFAAENKTIFKQMSDIPSVCLKRKAEFIEKRFETQFLMLVYNWWTLCTVICIELSAVAVKSKSRVRLYYSAL